MLILPLLINITMRSSRAHSQRSCHIPKTTARSLHNSQLEAREAVTSKTNYKSISEAYQARTKKPKRKRSSTNNSCTEPQGTKTLQQLRNTASDDGNRAAEIPI